MVFHEGNMLNRSTRQRASSTFLKLILAVGSVCISLAQVQVVEVDPVSVVGNHASSKARYGWTAAEATLPMARMQDMMSMRRKSS
jgi:hypothetical protein